MKTIISQANRLIHQGRNIISRLRLKNKDVSIISCNCIGGVIYHDLHLPFLSPTINLFFEPDSFLKYVKRIRYYNEKDLIDISGEKGYPVGKIEDVEVHFLHYRTFEDALKCWNTRKKRINYDNIVVIMTDQNISSEKMFEAFEDISYPKVMLTNKHLKYEWCKYIRGFDDSKYVGNTIEYFNKGRRYYEQFDYVKFLNSAMKQKEG